MKVYCVAFLSVLWLTAFGQEENEALLRELDATLQMRGHFEREKLETVRELKGRIGPASLPEKFDITKAIYDEYKSFVYDSAFLYARGMDEFFQGP